MVIELKVGDFDPSYLGQLGMYMAAVDDLLRHAEDKPTIGLLLCKTKNNVVAEYAAARIHRAHRRRGVENRHHREPARRTRIQLAHSRRTRSRAGDSRRPHARRRRHDRIQ